MQEGQPDSDARKNNQDCGGQQRDPSLVPYLCHIPRLFPHYRKPLLWIIGEHSLVDIALIADANNLFLARHNHFKTILFDGAFEICWGGDV